MPTPSDRDIAFHHDRATPDPNDPRAVLARFRQRLRAGSYDALLGHGLRRTLQGAAADAGLEAEIGALRLTLIRLLHEEHDPSRLAASVARIAGVAVQAARLRVGSDTDLETIRTHLLRELEAVEQDVTQETQRKQETIHHDQS
jgi:hypothetical protein